ncbi:MAG TPA: hypothetical protein PKL78_15925 [Anaerolineales bacterium]|nr:hypothetical protein [Anaerolineales bacterium]
MKITRDIITDLLPVYLSGEASADTKALVEEFLKQEPDFAKLIGGNGAVLPEGQINISKDNEMDTLNKTSKLLRNRSTYLAFTILFLLLPFSFKFDSKGLYWMWSDTPINVVIFLALGLIFGVQYWRISRKLKSTDL